MNPALAQWCKDKGIEVITTEHATQNDDGTWEEYYPYYEAMKNSSNACGDGHTEMEAVRDLCSRLDYEHLDQDLAEIVRTVPTHTIDGFEVEIPYNLEECRTFLKSLRVYPNPNGLDKEIHITRDVTPTDAAYRLGTVGAQRYLAGRKVGTDTFLRVEFPTEAEASAWLATYQQAIRKLAAEYGQKLLAKGPSK